MNVLWFRLFLTFDLQVWPWSYGLGSNAHNTLPYHCEHLWVVSKKMAPKVFLGVKFKPRHNVSNSIVFLSMIFKFHEIICCEMIRQKDFSQFLFELKFIKKKIQISTIFLKLLQLNIIKYTCSKLFKCVHII